MDEVVDQLDSMSTKLADRSNGLVWQGSDADAYRERVGLARTSEWLPLRTKLLTAVATLRHNADAQDDVSSALGGASGSSGSAAPGTQQSDPGAADRYLSPGTPPKLVAQWWAGLSPEDQRRLIEENPSLIGNTDGIPLDTRYEINQDAVERFLAEHGSGEYKGLRDALGEDDAHILMFDPSGDGRVAVVLGDLSTAQDIAVVVPGIGNALDNFSVEHSLAIRSEAGNDVATIQWLGYDTPSGPQGNDILDLAAGRPDRIDLLKDPAAVSPARATEWASSLASFTDGLKATSNAEISVVAHSYGTVLATEAGKIGMNVDRVILMGSPGVPADDMSVFNGAEVFAVRNVGDYVSTGSAHGIDPTDPNFGAKVLNSNDWRPTSSRVNAHTSYLDRGSDSLNGVVGAITSSKVGPDGLITQRIVHEDGSADIITTATF